MSFILLGILNSQAAGAGGAGSYDLLETTVLTSSASSVSFTGLDSYTDYKHLQIRATTRTDRTSATDILRFQTNADTGSNYAFHALMGNGSSVFSFAGTSDTSVRIANQSSDGDDANAFTGHVIDLLDFSSTTKNSTFRALSGYASTTPFLSLASGLYNDTSAITSINFFNNYADDFKIGSRFSLYGIKG